jgi:hypothetical protein
VPRLLAWLDERQPDVVCLQKTKLADKAFATLLDRECEARRDAWRGRVERRGDPFAGWARRYRARHSRWAWLSAPRGPRDLSSSEGRATRVVLYST